MYKVTIYLPMLATLLLAVACGGRTNGSDGEKVIKSGKAGGITVRISSASGELRKGPNDLTIAFVDESGQPADVTAASLNFHMPAMGTMAEMNDKAAIATTGTPGKYTARVEIEVPGTWEAQIKFQTSRDSGETSMTVQAR
jgi:hypothetical protein